MKLQLVPRAAQADFLDLPWHAPLEAWESARLVEVPRGIGRHVVRFVDYGGVFFALKELPPEIAAREYRLLRALGTRGIAAVEAVGVVSKRGDELPDVLITRYLDFSLPYRLALARRQQPDRLEQLLDAFAQLLVRIHLSGFFWGDCSLSNALFRRDAGELAAYLVDAETGELQPRLSDGQRDYDLQIAEENVFAELLDVAARHGRVDDDEAERAAALAAEIRARYERLWTELTLEEEVPAGDSGRFDARLRRLNDLGFDADEVELVETEGGFRLRVEPKVMEPGHHRRRLLRLTGLDAQENQARRLLADVDAYRRRLDAEPDPPPSETAAVARWLAEVFEPAVAAIPADLRDRRDAAQLFHELLEHRWYLSERAGEEVPLMDAVDDYVEQVLRDLPEERRLLPSVDDGYGIGYG